jgi:FkbM family methyltransferase
MIFDEEIDLVDFGDIQIFMFKNDNLYNLNVTAERKGRSPRDYQCWLRDNKFIPSPVRPGAVEEINSARYALSLVTVHFWQQKIPFRILDIGAFVGDFSLRMGNLARTFGEKTQVHAFDPTEAGSLIPFNIALNGLNDFVHHENIAVSDVDGPLLLHAIRGLSDATATSSKGTHHFSMGTLFNFFTHSSRKGAFLQKIASYLTPKKKYSLLVPSVRLETWFAERAITGSIFAKIDIEGIDAVVFESLRCLTAGSHLVSIVEFNPYVFDSFAEAGKRLREWDRDFIIFDIWYSPNPCFCRRVILDNGPLVFISEIAEKRIFNYTDLLLLPRTLPGVNDLAARLASLKEEPLEYTL